MIYHFAYDLYDVQVRALQEKLDSCIQQQFLDVQSPEETGHEAVLSVGVVGGMTPTASEWNELRKLEQKIDVLCSTSTKAYDANSQLRNQFKQLQQSNEVSQFFLSQISQ